jgi:hypothetical protein
MSNFSNVVQLPAASDINLHDFLPTNRDKVTLQDNFTILVGRILSKYMPFLSELGKGLPRHIPQEFSHKWDRNLKW